MAGHPRPRWRPTRTQVGAFLEAASRHGELTDEVYEKYAPLVVAAGKRGLPRYRAALSMVASAPGAEPPTVEAFQYAREQRRAEHLANAEEAQQLTEHDAEVARIYVTRVRAETGAGPTWAELGEHLGWPERLRGMIVWRLQRDGVLVFTREPRSLDVAD